MQVEQPNTISSPRAIIVHGGATTLAADKLGPSRRGCLRALEAGWAHNREHMSCAYRSTTGAKVFISKTEERSVGRV